MCSSTKKEIFQENKSYENWNLDKALSMIQEANSINPQPAYRQVEGNILFAQKKYDEAYNVFTGLTKTNMDKAEMWFAAARCREMQKDTTAMLALMDSTMATFTKPYLKQAGPYLWARANARIDAKKYRDAVNDLNDYEQLMAAQVNARFYYIRSQAEIEGRLYQQALNDLTKAMRWSFNSLRFSISALIDSSTILKPTTNSGRSLEGFTKCACM